MDSGYIESRFNQLERELKTKSDEILVLEARVEALEDQIAAILSIPEGCANHIRCVAGRLGDRMHALACPLSTEYNDGR